MTEDLRERSFVQHERIQLMLDLCKVVRSTGEYVLGLERSKIFDTVEVARHQFSTVDAEAGSFLRKSIKEFMGTFRGTVLEESDIPRRIPNAADIVYPIVVCDAVEGSTNAKRGLASHLRRPLWAGTSAMILERSTLASIAASAFFDFASGKVFSSVRAEPGSFISFADGTIIPQSEVTPLRGDSQLYAIVPGYSHGNITSRADVERALLSVGVRSTGGSRSSAQDLVDLLCNQADAYVDLRALFSGQTDSRDEVLHAWDVGGILPVLDGLGFVIMDAHGRGWQQSCFGEHLALIVTRPSMGQQVLQALQGLPYMMSNTEDAELMSVPLPPKSIG